MRDWFKCPGVGGFPDFLHIKDRYTGRCFCEPVESKDSEETHFVLNNTRGNDTVDRIYCDNWTAFEKAVKQLGVMWEPSQPGVHQNNAIIERSVLDVLEGARTCLRQADLPACC